MGLSKQQLEWIEYLTGSIKEADLSPENKAKAQAKMQERQDLIDQGIVPTKPFPAGIVTDED